MQASRIEMNFFMGGILRVGWSFQCSDLVATTIGYTILGGETSTHFFIRLRLHELSGIMALSQRRGCHHGEITASA